MGEAGAATEAVVTVTEGAARLVRQIRADEPDPASLALWIEVAGVQGDAFRYDVYFELAGDAGPGDVVERIGDDLALVIPSASVEQLKGATLDVAGSGEDAELIVSNPNRPPRLSPTIPEPDLSDPVTQRIAEVLEEEINPSIAMHGGRADLVSFEEGTVFVVLSGGCQGCGLASVTLSQGIEVALREAVPEVLRVVDVTDHASGTDPYFQGSKK
jgi:Fe/S biogenesis protein NfuA